MGGVDEYTVSEPDPNKSEKMIGGLAPRTLAKVGGGAKITISEHGDGRSIEFDPHGGPFRRELRAFQPGE